MPRARQPTNCVQPDFGSELHILALASVRENYDFSRRVANEIEGERADGLAIRPSSIDDVVMW
jgi:hypothetical protein